MKIVNEKSIAKINQEQTQEENRDKSIQSLTTELAKEKIKGMQKDVVIKQQNEEIVKIKLDIMQIKGGI